MAIELVIYVLKNTRRRHEYRTFFAQDLYEVESFVAAAREEDLLVILRPGPYIDSERDFGGLPWWLLAKRPKVELRSRDPVFLAAVDKWLSALYGRLRPHMRHNGGNIIAVQVIIWGNGILDGC